MKRARVELVFEDRWPAGVVLVNHRVVSLWLVGQTQPARYHTSDCRHVRTRHHGGRRFVDWQRWDWVDRGCAVSFGVTPCKVCHPGSPIW